MVIITVITNIPMYPNIIPDANSNTVISIVLNYRYTKLKTD